MIPFELKIFNYLYEYGRWLTVILVFAWLFYALLLMIRLNKWFWLWVLLLPCVILPLDVGRTWCGWHYRMELRDRYAVDEHGWLYIDRMPPEIRAEYAKHDYHPRFRDIKAQICGCIVMFPVVYFFGGLVWGMTCIIWMSCCERKGTKRE